MNESALATMSVDNNKLKEYVQKIKDIIEDVMPFPIELGVSKMMQNTLLVIMYLPVTYPEGFVTRTLVDHFEDKLKENKPEGLTVIMLRGYGEVI